MCHIINVHQNVYITKFECMCSRIWAEYVLFLYEYYIVAGVV